MSEERDKLVIKRLKEIQSEIGDIIQYISEPTKAKKETPPKTPQSTSFEDIDLEYQDFDLLNISVAKIFPRKEGTNYAGNSWEKQSVMIKDHAGTERELIAWGEAIELFEQLRVGDSYNLLALKKVTEYKRKDGKTAIQYTVGSSTSIERVSKE